MTEAVLFDMDRTLIHCVARGHGCVVDDAAQRFHQWLGEKGYVAPPFRSYRRRVGWRLLGALLWSKACGREVRLMQTLRKSHSGMGIDLSETEWTELGLQCIPTFQRFYPPEPTAVQTLASLRQTGLKLGLVSNTMLPAFFVDEHLRASALLEYLPVRVYSSEARYKKPHPRIFRLALEQLGVGAERTMFVGDSAAKDIAGSAHLGMRTVLVVRNGKVPRCRVAPDHVIKLLSELPAILKTGTY